MARQPFQAEYTTFVKGLITEANPLTFPENASLEELNFVLNPDGSRQRRLGMDFEDGYVKIDTGIDINTQNVAVSAHTWAAVANRGDLDFAVIQIGNKLYFFDSNAPSVSGSQKNKGNPITITGSNIQTISGASLYGNFLVVNGEQTVKILTYNVDTDTVALTTSRLTIRDLFGVDDALAIDNRPTTLTDAHKYNLRNQGWPASMPIADASLTTATDDDPIEVSKTRIGAYPANSDVVWACKISSAKEVAAINSFSPEELKRTLFGSSRAPLGRYILDVFNRGASRSSASGITTPTDQSSGGLIAVASFSGRVFYAIRELGRTGTDSRSPNIGTMIFYSMAKDSQEYFTKCHAEADPSSEHVFDPIATDGGFITIPEAGEVQKLVTMGSSLFVFCTNGVWEIHGGEGAFSATSQEVSKTTDIGIASPRSVVYAEDKIAYWGLSGIYLITRNELTLRGSNNDMTYSTIQTLYDKIDGTTKKEAVGTYDPYTRTFRWLYRDNVLPNSSLFNKELIFDVNLGAFYIHSIDVPTFDFPYIAGFVKLSGVIFVSETEKVKSGTDDVLVVTDNVVVDVRKASSEARGSVKYLAVLKEGNTHKFTLSYYKDLDFRDWKTYDGVGVDAAARMLTGYITGGVAMADKRVDYIHVYLVRTEQGFDSNGNTIGRSSCTMQTQWEWTNSPFFGRWGRPFEAYRLPRVYLPIAPESEFDYSYTTVVSKNKIRGHGRALSILFQTQPYHDLHLLGWSVTGSAGVK